MSASWDTDTLGWGSTQPCKIASHGLYRNQHYIQINFTQVVWFGLLQQKSAKCVFVKTKTMLHSGCVFPGVLIAAESLEIRFYAFCG